MADAVAGAREKKKGDHSIKSENACMLESALKNWMDLRRVPTTLAILENLLELRSWYPGSP